MNRTVGKVLLTYYLKKKKLQAFVLKEAKCRFTSLKPLIKPCKNIREKNEYKIGAIPKGMKHFFVLYFHWKSGDFAYKHLISWHCFSN